METRICQNCKNDFIIESDDFSFYDKMKVPAPTFCRECRMVRRMLWRNERIWYRRPCDATGKNVLSVFDPQKPYKVYDQEYWRSDAWDPMEYGKEYDFSKTFFEQFSDLFSAIPHPNLIAKNNVNSEYSNISLNLKNCYMAIGTDGAEDSAYINGMIRRVKECFDLYQCLDDEYCYDCVDCEKSNQLFFSQNSVGCSDSFFLYDCRNCINCIGCVNLRNKQYHIFNQPYSREDYLKILEEINTGNWNSLTDIKQKFEELRLREPKKYALIINSQNVTGDDILNSRNCSYCFNSKDGVENCSYSYRINQNTKDGMDGYIIWNGAELFYDTLSATAQNVKFSGFIWGGFEIEYSYNCFDCNNIFGCVGLKNKSYCILNKQYEKSEYESLVFKIKEHMDSNKWMGTSGRVYGYGEFFPAELSPFSYNETAAQEYFPMEKDKVLIAGLTWKDPDEKKYTITMLSGQIPEDIKDVSDAILSEVIECAHQGQCRDQCSTAFKIIPSELSFLKRFNLPLPRLCSSCRHMDRIRLKNPFKLWRRACMCEISTHGHGEKCEVEFETSYSPDRPEKVYCEKCYQQEVI